MNKELLKEAFDFYDITNPKYLKKCIECLNSINNKPELLEKTAFIHKQLFLNKKENIQKLWNKSSNISDDLPYINDVILLSGYRIHQSNMNNKKISKEQKMIHKYRVKEILEKNLLNDNYNGISKHQMLWGTYFINIYLIEVGRLQYEHYDNFNIKIHIPSGNKLLMTDVCKSLEQSKLLIKKYFNMTEYNYLCNSWLLSKDVHNLIESKSNIYNFYNLFDIENGDDCIDDILKFVYDTKETDYCKLPEKTSLQRKIKKYLLKGNIIREGRGILKK